MMAPNARRRRKKFGILGGVLYKKHEPPGGSAPAAGGKFLGIWGALYTKITLLGCIQERVSGAKHPQNPQKFPPAASQTPKMCPYSLTFPGFGPYSLTFPDHPPTPPSSQSISLKNWEAVPSSYKSRFPEKLRN